MSNNKTITTRQLIALALYAYNYTYQEIAEQLDISIRAVGYRLENVRIHHPDKWANAIAIRRCYQAAKKNVQRPMRFGYDDPIFVDKMWQKPPVTDAIQPLQLLQMAQTYREQQKKLKS